MKKEDMLIKWRNRIWPSDHLLKCKQASCDSGTWNFSQSLPRIQLEPISVFWVSTFFVLQSKAQRSGHIILSLPKLNINSSKSKPQTCLHTDSIDLKECSQFVNCFHHKYTSQATELIALPSAIFAW